MSTIDEYCDSIELDEIESSKQEQWITRLNMVEMSDHYLINSTRYLEKGEFCHVHHRIDLLRKNLSPDEMNGVAFSRQDLMLYDKLFYKTLQWDKDIGLNKSKPFLMFGDSHESILLAFNLKTRGYMVLWFMVKDQAIIHINFDFSMNIFSSLTTLIDYTTLGLGVFTAYEVKGLHSFDHPWFITNGKVYKLPYQIHGVSNELNKFISLKGGVDVTTELFRDFKINEVFRLLDASLIGLLLKTY